jgi:hypothetical protein
MARKDFRIVCDKFANDSALPFGRILTRDYVLSVLEDEGLQYRQGVFCPLVTLWGWLSQCLSAQDAWHWRGREVFLADGTGLSMPDTLENQRAFPQIRSIKPGLGFPVMRAVALISLSTGAVVDFDFAAHEGTGTGEGNLLRRMLDTLRRDDILVADRTRLLTALETERGGSNRELRSDDRRGGCI